MIYAKAAHVNLPLMRYVRTKISTIGRSVKTHLDMKFNNNSTNESCTKITLSNNIHVPKVGVIGIQIPHNSSNL